MLLPWHPKESNFQSGLSLEALPLLWKAERCGLHGQHWIVDALRALAAEDLRFFLCFFLVLLRDLGWEYWKWFTLVLDSKIKQIF